MAAKKLLKKATTVVEKVVTRLDNYFADVSDIDFANLGNDALQRWTVLYWQASTEQKVLLHRILANLLLSTHYDSYRAGIDYNNLAVEAVNILQTYLTNPIRNHQQVKLVAAFIALMHGHSVTIALRDDMYYGTGRRYFSALTQGASSEREAKDTADIVTRLTEKVSGSRTSKTQVGDGVRLKLRLSKQQDVMTYANNVSLTVRLQFPVNSANARKGDIAKFLRNATKNAFYTRAWLKTFLSSGIAIRFLFIRETVLQVTASAIAKIKPRTKGVEVAPEQSERCAAAVNKQVADEHGPNDESTLVSSTSSESLKELDSEEVAKSSEPLSPLIVKAETEGPKPRVAIYPRYFADSAALIAFFPTKKKPAVAAPQKPMSSAQIARLVQSFTWMNKAQATHSQRASDQTPTNCHMAALSELSKASMRIGRIY